jgi:hypothetical protein
MSRFYVHFSFDADTLEEAEAILGTWKVTPGVTLMSLSGSVQSMTNGPQPIPYGGSVGAALKSAEPLPPPKE